MTKENTDNWKWLQIIITVLLIIIAIWIWFFIWNNNSLKNTTEKNTTNDTIEESTTKENNKNINITVIWDKRCTDCKTNLILEQIKTAPFLKNANFSNIIDFSDEWTEKIMKENNITKLPAFIFNTNQLNDQWAMANFLTPTPSGNFTLNVWSEFDPYAEICSNWVDDNWNWLVDCEDPTCWKELSCAPKVDKPVAELFIMSYCPYWTQAQKWFLEAMLKLKDVADMRIKFVHYLMHWSKEWEENIVQACIQKNEKEKYIPYLQCFLKEWKNKECLTTANINTDKLNTCITETKKDINYEEKIADKTKQFPEFSLDMEEALNYWVQWSPTFVLNWIKVDKVWRDAKSYADLICNSFKEKPAVCNEDFSTTTYDPNFGFTSWWKSVEWGCWQ